MILPEKEKSVKKKKLNHEFTYALVTIITATLLIALVWICVDNEKKHKTDENNLAVLDAHEFVNDNKPFFSEADFTTQLFEYYSDLDELGRCGVAFANVSKELMPTEKRGDIGSVKPSGWRNVKYPGIIDESPPFLYNRCHLIAYCLTGENANEKNLITGTRYMNTRGMLPFEEEVARYLKYHNNHVLYRVTPVFDGINLVASGVLMEGYSVEDNGAGICFCVYCYNIQPGIEIDYKTGKSWAVD